MPLINSLCPVEDWRLCLHSIHPVCPFMTSLSLSTPQNAIGWAQPEQASRRWDEKPWKTTLRGMCPSSPVGVHSPFSSESMFAKFEEFLRLKTNARGYFCWTVGQGWSQWWIWELSLTIWPFSLETWMLDGEWRWAMFFLNTHMCVYTDFLSIVELPGGKWIQILNPCPHDQEDTKQWTDLSPTETWLLEHTCGLCSENLTQDVTASVIGDLWIRW